MDYWAKAPIKREQIVLFAHMLDDAIPDDHPVRLFDEILAARDWSPWKAEYHGSRGQPPIHPKVLAGVLLYGLTRGVRSSRQLEYLVKHNVDFMWLAEGHKPDHSTICEFRTKFREPLKDLFRQIGRTALAMGVARLNEVALDGTRVKANNARSETMTAANIEKRLAALDEQLEKMLQEAEAADASDQELFDTGESSTQLPPELADVKARQERLKKALEQVQAAEKARRREGIDPKKNPAQIPSTDPDSKVLPNKEGGYAPNYTPMAAAEGHGGFIMDLDVINDTSEHTVTVATAERIEENFGQRPEKLLADGAHATGQNIEKLEELGVDFYTNIQTNEPQPGNPALRDDPKQPVPESEWKKLPRNPQTKKLDKSAFLYDEETDRYSCPQGKPLTYEQTKSKPKANGERVHFRVYRCADCEGCPLASECRSEKAKKGRSISRDVYEKRRQQFAAKMATEESKAIYARRFHMGETPFGIIKGVMHLRQFLLRGMEKVTTEWLWTCTAFNLAKLVREVARLRAEFGNLLAEGAS
jgi:transposase